MPRSPGKGSLFERLDPELPPRRSRTRQELAAERIRAIKRQLELILNTRQGSAQSCPNLGLRDLNDADAGSADLHLQICQDIRLAVAAYEPRAQVIDVHPLPAAGQPQDLHLRLQCLIPLNHMQERVEIDLLFHHHDRQVKVK
ncbi:type VI secretion system baseplate subunit TssE [Pseudomonas sp. R5(2019)]|uniref:type VI secretion system baseplate subunit TssE n=1 Tax=Pseudomonas sp. R5(2019) TaxID=2697566 RepID=UPI0014133430|nr:type VI secretion system baseplate subunit TssE [Pseudomonas sp. R5(2019)]NBA94152.1 type VI secretion system baseplate subunit TssE [Pseudomonas sp. R5(2019)]